MHVIWKRPDGFHGAQPSDFKAVEVSGRCRIWLHNEDHSHFPFRISGGWQESEATVRLNNLINLLPEDEKAWADGLCRIFDNSMSDNPENFFSDMINWIKDLRNHLKGDTWEMDIMSEVLDEVKTQLNAVQDEFLSRAKVN